MGNEANYLIAEHFSTLSDPRIELKTRHKLIDIIAVTLCAVICGADKWIEIARFGRAKEQWFRTFPALPQGIPSHDTFGRIFSLLDPEQFAQVFCQLGSRGLPDEPSQYRGH